MPPKGIPSYRPPFMATNHMVASGHYLASMAGYRILNEGGNAIDAGVASGIATNITIAEQTNFGGVAPIMVYRADTGEVATISGVGCWPEAVDLENYVKKYNGEIPRGMPRCVVPSACDAWLTALEIYGTMSFEQVIAPSIELAEKGFPASYRMARLIEQQREFIQESPSTAEIFLPGGKPFQVGQIVVQKDMARTFHRMVEAEKGSSHKGREAGIRAARDLFYKGDIAEEMASFCQQEGGLLTKEDLANFNVQVEKPQSGTYKDYTLYTCGPWCQGPSLIQVLNILEGFDLRGMGHNSLQYLHTLVESIKLSYADRHEYYADPDFVEVPMAGLLSKKYADQRRQLLDPEVACPQMPIAGDPYPLEGRSNTREPVPAIPREGRIGPDTAYTCVVDRWGNAFSATTSDAFTSTPIVPGVGVAISGRGGQSWLDPIYPNCLAPGKRPRMTPCAAMCFKDGQLYMPFGTPGEDMQVQAQAQIFLNMVEFGLDPQQAMEEPRVRSTSFPSSGWPHAYFPAQLYVEGRIEKEVGEGLAGMGHDIVWRQDWMTIASSPCAIVVDRERGILIGGADPHRDSYAMGS